MSGLFIFRLSIMKGQYQHAASKVDNKTEEKQGRSGERMHESRYEVKKKKMKRKI